MSLYSFSVHPYKNYQESTAFLNNNKSLHFYATLAQVDTHKTLIFDIKYKSDNKLFPEKDSWLHRNDSWYSVRDRLFKPVSFFTGTSCRLSTSSTIISNFREHLINTYCNIINSPKTIMKTKVYISTYGSLNYVCGNYSGVLLPDNFEKIDTNYTTIYCAAKIELEDASLESRNERIKIIRSLFNNHFRNNKKKTEI